MKLLLALTAFSLPLSVSANLPTHQGTLIELDNGYYSILYNCEKRGYEHYFYVTQADTGNVKRKSGFFQDTRLPKKCQQYGTFTYKTPRKSPKFDRGHGVPANHMDFDKKASDSTNAFSNIVPQSAPLNRQGLWRHTDKLIECNRDNGPITVYGGVIWGDDKSNDYFVDSHGVETPDFLYKIIIKPTGERNAWVMPNSNVAKENNADNYLVSVSYIESQTGVIFDLPNKHNVAAKSFSLPSSCDLS